MNIFFEIFSPNFVLREALWESLILGVLCPLVGVYFVLRRMIFMAVALPQVSSAGIAFAFLMGGLLNNEVHGKIGERALAATGSFGFTALTIVALSLWESQRLFPREAQTAVTFAICSTLTVLFLSMDPHGEALMVTMLRGDMLAATDTSLHVCILVSALIGIVLFVFRREFLLISYDRDLAVLSGLPVQRYEILLYVLCGGIVSFGVSIAGTIVTFGLLIIPPLAARCICDEIKGFSLRASLIGGFSSLAGFLVSYSKDLPLGPCVVLVAVGVLASFWIVRRMFT